MHPKDELGHRGERAAAEHLEKLGMRVLDRNWRCKHGEVDIVAQDGTTTVIVEVKTRRSVRFGHPFEAITRQKVRRLRTLAALWMRDHDVRGNVRLDAVAVLALEGEPWRIEHLRGIA